MRWIRSRGSRGSCVGRRLDDDLHHVLSDHLPKPDGFGVLGGHIEKDSDGNTYAWESQYHPHEAALQMTKDDLLALPGVVRSFNGFYNTNGNFILMNAIRLLIAEAILAAGILAGIVWALVRYIRRRRARKIRSQVQT